MRSNKKGIVLLDRFKRASERGIDGVMPLHLKAEGIQLLQESEMPSHGFKKAGFDLSSWNYQSLPASCAKPSVLLQGSAILDQSISKINLQTFDSFINVIFDDITSWPRIPRKWREVCGRQWHEKMYKAISEQHMKYMLYQMLIGGIRFEIKDEIIAVHSLVKFILSKPGASTLKTFMKEADIDTRDMLAVYQAWKEYGFVELFTFSYKKNPYFNPTRADIIKEYKRDISKGGVVDLAKYGASKDVVGDSQEFDLYSSSAAVLKCMEEFVSRKKGSKLNQAFQKSTGRRVKPRRGYTVNRYELTDTGKEQEATAGSVFQEIETYAQLTGLGLQEALRRFCALYAKMYGEDITEKTEVYRKRNCLERASYTQYLAATGRLRDGLECAKALTTSVCVS